MLHIAVISFVADKDLAQSHGVFPALLFIAAVMPSRSELEPREAGCPSPLLSVSGTEPQGTPNSPKDFGNPSSHLNSHRVGGLCSGSCELGLAGVVSGVFVLEELVSRF